MTTKKLPVVEVQETKLAPEYEVKYKCPNPDCGKINKEYMRLDDGEDIDLETYCIYCDTKVSMQKIR